MKFIIQSDHFHASLQSWAEDSDILVPSFFFLRQGAIEQRSFNGALRTLLHQLISARPVWMSFIPVGLEQLPLWTDKVLLASLKAIVQQGLDGVKICFVLDGFDEMEDDIESRDSMMSLFHDLCQDSRIKLLVSSRPEPYFREALGSHKFICLQDLTREDIRTFVEQKLLKNHHWRRLTQSSPREAELVINETTARADGVFLWVRLAVSDIIGGLGARDDLRTLKDRLSYLDPSLNGLFAQLLGRIHRVHRTRSANSLKLAIRRAQIQSLDLGRFSLIHLALVLDDHFRSRIYRILSSNDLGETDMREMLEYLIDLPTSIAVQSAGLLEIIDHRPKHRTVDCAVNDSMEDHTVAADLKLVSRRFYDYYIKIKVQMVHRSAIEFLEEDEIAVSLMSNATLKGEQVDEQLVNTAQLAAKLALFMMRHAEERFEPRRDLHRIQYLSRAFTREWALVMCTLKLSKADHTLAHVHTKLDTVCSVFTSMVQHHHLHTSKSEISPEMRDSWRMLDRSLLHMASYIPVECVFIGQIIAEGFASWAFKCLQARFHTECLTFFFNISIESLTRICAAPRKPYILLIDRLIELGLPVNANLAGRKPCGPFHADSKERAIHWPTIWERYLLWMYAQIVTPQSSPHESVHDRHLEIMKTVQSFIDKGADANARFVIEQSCLHNLETGGSIVTFTVEMSALALLRVYCCMTESNGDYLEMILRGKGAKWQILITRIFADAPHPDLVLCGYNVLQIPSRSEQEALGQAYNDYLVRSGRHTVREMREKACNTLDEKVWQVWTTNLNFVERRDGSALLERPTHRHSLVNAANEPHLMFPSNLALRDEPPLLINSISRIRDSGWLMSSVEAAAEQRSGMGRFADNPRLGNRKSKRRSPEGLTTDFGGKSSDSSDEDSDWQVL